MRTLINLTTTFTFVLINCIAFAQVDLKINPIGTIFEKPEISAELVINESVGLETTLGFNAGSKNLLGYDFKKQGFIATLTPRYYFNPKNGADRFYMGMYGKFKTNQFTTEIENIDLKRTEVDLGFLTGIKLLGKRGIMFDTNFGIGRKMMNNYTSKTIDSSELLEIPKLNIDFTSTVTIGFRIK